MQHVWGKPLPPAEVMLADVESLARRVGLPDSAESSVVSVPLDGAALEGACAAPCADEVAIEMAPIDDAGV